MKSKFYKVLETALTLCNAQETPLAILQTTKTNTQALPYWTPGSRCSSRRGGLVHDTHADGHRAAVVELRHHLPGVRLAVVPAHVAVLVRAEARGRALVLALVVARAVRVVPGETAAASLCSRLAKGARSERARTDLPPEGQNMSTYLVTIFSV